MNGGYSEAKGPNLSFTAHRGSEQVKIHVALVQKQTQLGQLNGEGGDKLSQDRQLCQKQMNAALPGVTERV